MAISDEFLTEFDNMYTFPTNDFNLKDDETNYSTQEANDENNRDHDGDAKDIESNNIDESVNDLNGDDDEEIHDEDNESEEMTDEDDEHYAIPADILQAPELHLDLEAQEKHKVFTKSRQRRELSNPRVIKLLMFVDKTILERY